MSAVVRLPGETEGQPKTPRLYGPHDYQEGRTCRRPFGDCAAFSRERHSLRSRACGHCGLCMGCVFDVEFCTTQKSRVPMRPEQTGAGDLSQDPSLFGQSPAPVAPTRRRVGRRGGSIPRQPRRGSAKAHGGYVR